MAGVAAIVVTLGVGSLDCGQATNVGRAGEAIKSDDRRGGDAPAISNRPEEASPPSPSQLDVFSPPDRPTLRLLTKAQQLAEQDRYAEAVRCLGGVLESPQDHFYRPDKHGSSPCSLKSEARRLLGQMPPRGRELYELQYGARAKQLLGEAVRTGDSRGLEEVSRRFFHTRAGYEATMLLGLHHLDHGLPEAGAVALRQLWETSAAADRFEPALSLALATCWIRAGLPEKAGGVLSTLGQRYPRASARIAGQDVPVFASGRDPLERLTELLGPQVPAGVERVARWGMFRGNAARNASTSGDGPLLSVRWRIPASDHPFLDALIEQIRETDQQWDRAALPGVHPLVVDDVVLTRTAGSLVAADLGTGKRLWRAPVDDPFETLLDLSQNLPSRRVPQMEYALRLRLWADATYGTISSDGRCVFAVEGLGLEPSPMQFHAVLIRGRASEDSAGPKPYNRLAAYDIHTGKLKWHVGGASEEFGLPQAGEFFLGPPLPLMGRLYVLAEASGEIRLMVLDGETGELIWLQPLSGTEQRLLRDPLRRLAGAAPSYSDGILVCPTSNRSIVAVDLATRSLRWCYGYPQTEPASAEQRMFFGPRTVMDPDPVGRWTDSAAILAEGCVLATPADSDQLHCLDLADGGLLWREPRNDDLYLACVHEGKAILVGRRRVRTLRLRETLEPPPEETAEGAEGDGPVGTQDCKRPAPAWGGRTLEFPPGSMPSGRGFSDGNYYYVPLDRGEVMAFDLDSGRPARVFKSRREAGPGNLVCYQGKVLSQSAAGLELFDQWGALAKEVDGRLALAGQDAEALALRGEILWHEGKLGEAIRCLRRSLELHPDPNTRQRLRDALLDGLRVDFAVQRQHAAEIQRLLDGPQWQAMYLRLMATGHEKAGELRLAWEHYLKLIELDRQHREMEPVEESLSVRRDRWIQLRLASLREAVSGELKTEIDQLAEARLKAAEQSPEATERFLDYFGALPIADRARGQFVRRLQESGRRLSAELLLRGRERSEDPRVKGAAVAELARILRQAGKWEDAAVYYARLDQELADVVCREDKTGRELVEALPPDDPVRTALQPVSGWPQGKVEVTTSQPKDPPPLTYYLAPLPFDGSRSPFFSDVSVELHERPPQLVGRDGLGNPKWQLPLTDLIANWNFPWDGRLVRVAACGHLLLLVGPRQIVAVDTLGRPENGSPQLLWRRQLDELLADGSGARQLGVRLASRAWGVPRLDLARQSYEPTPLSWMVSEHVLCFKRLGSCVAVDPLTGKTLWRRDDVARQGVVFGDHDYVFIVPDGQTTAMALRAADGQLLGRREVPLERTKTLGRRVLAWREAGGGHVLELIDAWGGGHVWPSRKFAAGATLHYVEHEAAAVYEPSGRFVLVDLNDGRAMIDATLDPEPSLSEILVLPSPEQYVVIAYHEGSAPRQTSHFIQGVDSQRITRGRIYAFDRQGAPLWPSPVTIQDQWLPLGQPRRLPVLAFACRRQRQAGGQVGFTTSILCIDKRTGGELCRQEFRESTNTLRLMGGLTTKTVTLRLQTVLVTMAFTDQSADPDGG